MSLISEKSVGLAVQDWVAKNGWDCFPEAQLRTRGPRADLILTKHPLLWVIETKLALNIQVIEQALRWRTLGALYTSIAILKPKRTRYQKFVWHSSFVDRICRQEGLGLIFVDREDLSVFEAIEPKLHRYNYKKSKSIINALDPRMKQYIPGSTAQEGFSSPYQRTVGDALAFIADKGSCSIDEILENINTHFRIRIKARNFLIKHLCKRPDLSYRYDRYDVIFHCKKQ